MATFSVLSLLLLGVFAKKCISVASVPAPSKWETRVNATMQLIRSRPCLVVQKKSGCTDAAFISNIPTRKMNVYTAEEDLNGRGLKAVLPDKKYRSLTRNGRNLHRAVVVIDPYPEASFGHLVFIFFIDSGVGRRNCVNGSNRGIFTVNNECVTAARKRHCMNRISALQRRKCEINFIPLVYSQGDSSRSQKLLCNGQISGFAKCPSYANLQPKNCENLPKCPSPTASNMCTYERCDYAVLVSGGWSAQTLDRRFGENLEHFHGFLRRNDFQKNKIVTLYAQRAGFEPTSDDQKDNSHPVRDKFDVRNYIRDVCKDKFKSCVDSFVIYLTGPASNIGSLLFWDNDGDGLLQDSEMYSPTELLLDLKDCNAKRVFVVADHSYSGMLVEKLKSKAAHSHRKHFLKIAVLSSSSFNETSWPGVFTDSFITHSRPNGKSKSVANAFKDVKQDFKRQSLRYSPTMIEISPGSVTDSTIYGGQRNLTWCEEKSCTKKTPDIGCTILKRSEWPR